MLFFKMNASKAVAVRRAVCLLVISSLAALIACSSERSSPRYRAERMLFKARKLKDDFAAGGMKAEFLGQAAAAYRSVVREYGGAADSVAGLEEVVISAQMELGELEYRGGLLREARGDFEKAVALAKNVPAARANALYSAGVISEDLGEPAEAAQHYERFADEFLGTESLASTVRMNQRYLITPLKLADLATRLGDGESADRWLKEADRVFTYVSEHEKDPALLREARYNLLAASVQEKNWNRALALVKELKGLYPDPQDVSSIRYIEAKIYQDGLGNPARAKALYLSIAEEHPKAREAPDAILAAAGICKNAGQIDEAVELYEKIINSFKERISEVVEAQWQMAQIEELRGDPEAATLRYRSIYSDYPETLQGFEAPLRIARNYREHAAADAAKASYDKALEHYEGLVSAQRPLATRIMAEQYIVRTLVEAARLSEAVERLLKLPDRYPDYTPFRENYLRAASIYETELGDREQAKRTLEACAAKYPGTELAQAARKELARLKR